MPSWRSARSDQRVQQVAGQRREQLARRVLVLALAMMNAATATGAGAAFSTSAGARPAGAREAGARAHVLAKKWVDSALDRSEPDQNTAVQGACLLAVLVAWRPASPYAFKQAQRAELHHHLHREWTGTARSLAVTRACVQQPALSLSLEAGHRDGRLAARPLHSIRSTSASRAFVMATRLASLATETHGNTAMLSGADERTDERARSSLYRLHTDARVLSLGGRLPVCRLQPASRSS